MNNKKTPIIKYIIPPVITMILGLVILAVRGIYPFGSETIDYYDMSTQVSAFYYHVYDVLHGDKIYFFDWYSTLGSNMAITSGSSIFSVLNLFFLFVDRYHILESLSFFLILKMGLMSLSMYYSVHKAFKTNDYIENLVSIGYGFCGFVLMNFSILSWLDYAILVPLILYFASRLVKKGKSLGFIITLALGLMANYYLTFMTLVFIFLEVGFYLAVYRKSGKSPYSHLLKLGLGVLAAFGLSAGALIPQLYMTMTSARADNNVTGTALSFYTDILKQYNGGYASRWWVLLGLSFELAICLCGLAEDIKAKNFKRVIFAAGSMMIVSLPIVFENVNIFWHFGSYVQYPLRFSFLIYLTYAFAACVYAKDLFSPENLADFKKSKWMIASFIVTPVLVYYGNIIHDNAAYQPFAGILHITFLMIGASFAVYLASIIFKKGRFVKITCCIWVAEMLVYGILTLGNQTYITGYNEEPEQERDSVRICRQLTEQLGLENNRIDRIKNPDESLNANYGFFLQQPALSNWTHLIPKELQTSVQNLGYSTQFTRLLDAGGTVFTDALLHINRCISVNLQDTKLYTPAGICDVVSNHVTGKTKTYYLYNSIYKLPLVLPISEDGVEKVENSDNIVSLHNALYDAICPDELSCDSQFSEYLIGSNKESAAIDSDYEINVTGNKALYFTGSCPDTEYRNLSVSVNGKTVIIPDIGDADNTLYSAHFNNNAVYLGSFDSEDVSIKFLKTGDEDIEYTPCVFSVDLDMLKTLCDYYNSDRYNCSYTVESRSVSLDTEITDDAYFMIPIAYNPGWKYNMQSSNFSDNVVGTPKNFISCFMLLPNSSKDSFAPHCELTFTPPFLNEGILISILSALFIALASVIARPKNSSSAKADGKQPGILRAFIESKKTNRITGILYLIAWSAVLLLIFIIPVIYGVLCYLHIL